MRLLLLALSLAASVCAQGPFPRPFRELEEYLQLSREQMDRLNRNSTEFERWWGEKQNRTFQVQREIAEETAAEPLNPSALGLRYAELETIRREIAEREKKLITDNLAVLTDAQKAKFKTLEEALKLQPVIAQAQAIRLMENDCQVPTFSFPGLLTLPGSISPCGTVRLPIGRGPINFNTAEPAPNR